jgi:hypothetical protein
MTDYWELAELADRLFEISDDDVKRLADLLDTLDGEMRRELLRSDFLNAFQVFYYYFREHPTDIGEERLILQPAGAVERGIMFEEWELLEFFFKVSGDEPVIEISDGDRVVASFRGGDAYREAVGYAAESS